MIGLLLIFFLGKRFYELAEIHDKSPWGYAILGIASYYCGILIASFVTGGVIGYFDLMEITDDNEFVFGLFMIPFGLITWAILFYVIKRSWEENKVIDDEFAKY